MREILANLTARGAKMDRVSAGSIRPENLAYLLTGLKRGPLYLAEWKDLGVEASRVRLWAELHNVLKRLPSIKRWYNLQLLDKLINIALDEVGSTALCKTCNGRKQFTKENKVIVCPSCMGLGFRGRTDKDRAEFAGIPWTTWRRSWRDKYADVYRVVLIFDQSITRNIKRRMGNP